MPTTPPSVLVIEDDFELRGLLEAQLRKFGVVTTAVSDGEEAFVFLRKNRPDLVCLDLQLPVVSGYGVARFMRQDDRLKKVPIVIITARTGLDEQAFAQEIEAAAVIWKPFRMSQLQEILRKHFPNGAVT